MINNMNYSLQEKRFCSKWVKCF